MERVPPGSRRVVRGACKRSNHGCPCYDNEITLRTYKHLAFIAETQPDSARRVLKVLAGFKAPNEAYRFEDYWFTTMLKNMSAVEFTKDKEIRTRRNKDKDIHTKNKDTQNFS